MTSEWHYGACTAAKSADAAHAGLGLWPRSHADLCETVDITGRAEPHPRKKEGGRRREGKREEKRAEKRRERREEKREKGSNWRLPFCASPPGCAERAALIRCAVMQACCTSCSHRLEIQFPHLLRYMLPALPFGLLARDSDQAEGQTRSPKRASRLEGPGACHRPVSRNRCPGFAPKGIIEEKTRADLGKLRLAALHDDVQLAACDLRTHLRTE